MVPLIVTVGVAGAKGFPAGVTALEASDVVLVPLALVAVTLKRYESPFVRPVTLQPVAGAVAVHVNVPVVECTEYTVIGDPFVVDAVHETVAWPSPPVATTSVGASGFPAGMAVVDVGDGRLVPTALLAMTWNAYGAPFVRPSTVHMVDGEVAVHVNPVVVDWTR